MAAKFVWLKRSYLAISCPEELLVGIKASGGDRSVIVLVKNRLDFDEIVRVAVGRIDIHQYSLLVPREAD